jgi:glycosyltransferase involved in cell wall biosynthesis
MAIKPVILMPNFENNTFILDLIGQIKANIHDCKVVIVEDGTVEKKLNLESLRQLNLPISVINLKKNSGPQRAIATGLHYINDKFKSELVIIMDSDGEDSPNDLIKLLDFKKSNPNAQIIVATRLSRKNSVGFKLLYKIYKSLFRMVTGKSMNFGNFSLIDKQTLARLTNYSELWMHLGSTYLLSNLNISYLAIPRDSSYFGKKSASLSKLINHGIRSMIVLSELFIPRIFLLATTLLLINTSFVVVIFFLHGFGSLVYFGALFSFILILVISIVILFLGISRNSSEYNSTNYQQLISHVDHI